MKAHWLLGFALVPALGCGQAAAKIVPVSGVVTLNGKPLANATVTFAPVAPEGEINAAGDSSIGKTNANGEYTLTTSRGAPGAVVAKHRVRVTLLAAQENPESDERLPRGAVKDKIPVRYNGADTVLKFEVKADGPNKADLALTSP
jgi:hypothetical protein